MSSPFFAQVAVDVAVVIQRRILPLLTQLVLVYKLVPLLFITH